MGVSQEGQWHEGSGARRRTSAYRSMRQVALALESPVRVPYGEVWERTAGGALRSHKSSIPDLDVESETVAVVVTSGRTRWKIENEQGNVQQNHGSELTHHDGHGQPTVSMVFYRLHLIAYVAQVSVELGERLSQRCRAQESRRELWAALRALVTGLLVARWAHWLRRYLEEAEASP